MVDDIRELNRSMFGMARVWVLHDGFASERTYPSTRMSAMFQDCSLRPLAYR